jgi:hypothetical protein
MATASSEMLVTSSQTTQCHIPENNDLHTYTTVSLTLSHHYKFTSLQDLRLSQQQKSQLCSSLQHDLVTYVPTNVLQEPSGLGARMSHMQKIIILQKRKKCLIHSCLKFMTQLVLRQNNVAKLSDAFF